MARIGTRLATLGGHLTSNVLRSQFPHFANGRAASIEGSASGAVTSRRGTDETQEGLRSDQIGISFLGQGNHGKQFSDAVQMSRLKGNAGVLSRGYCSLVTAPVSSVADGSRTLGLSQPNLENRFNAAAQFLEEAVPGLFDPGPFGSLDFCRSVHIREGGDDPDGVSLVDTGDDVKKTGRFSLMVRHSGLEVVVNLMSLDPRLRGTGVSALAFKATVYLGLAMRQFAKTMDIPPSKLEGFPRKTFLNSQLNDSLARLSTVPMNPHSEDSQMLRAQWRVPMATGEEDVSNCIYIPFTLTKPCVDRYGVFFTGFPATGGALADLGGNIVGSETAYFKPVTLAEYQKCNGMQIQVSDVGVDDKVRSKRLLLYYLHEKKNPNAHKTGPVYATMVTLAPAAAKL